VRAGDGLAWSYTCFLRSFVRSRRTRHILNLIGSVTSFWLLFFDRFLINRPGATIAASGYYFMGRKSMHNPARSRVDFNIQEQRLRLSFMFEKVLCRR
jgi:hypothetical protein